MIDKRAHAVLAVCTFAMVWMICVPSGYGQNAVAAAADHAWSLGDPLIAAMNRGVGHMERYEYAKAVEAFEEAAKLAPKLREVRLNLAIAIFNRNAKDDLVHAGKLLDAIIAEEPNNVRALYCRGVICQHGGEDEQAARCFESVTKLAPNDPYAWYFLARSKEHLGQSSEGDLKKAVELCPNMVSAYYNLMRVARQAGKSDEAKRYQEMFAKLRENPLAEVVDAPRYQQTGPLALAVPMPGGPKRALTSGELSTGPAKNLLSGSPALALQAVSPTEAGTPAGKLRLRYGLQSATADVNGDDVQDIVTTAAVRNDQRSVALLLGKSDGTLTDATEKSGLAAVKGAMALAFGDFDNDGKIDLFVSCAGPNHLFKGRGDGTFEDVTEKTRTAGGDVISVSAVLLDADHDSDLDIYVCNATSADGSAPAANQLLNNNGDGTFTDIAGQAGVACKDQRSIMLAAADLDGDRDTDLIVFQGSAPASVFFNDRLGKYHEGKITAEPIRGDFGGVLQDFNGDGRPDLLVNSGAGSPGHLYLSDASGRLVSSSQFEDVMKSVATWGPATGVRVLDIDLDGDLDITVLGKSPQLLLNDGWGRFVLTKAPWQAADNVLVNDLLDLTGDGIADLVRVTAKPGSAVELIPQTLNPPANWLAIAPTGDRGEDKRTRSPASGYGSRIEIRCGVHSQVLTYSGLSGGLSQSLRPALFGVDGASKADYIAVLWPDGVTQSEVALNAGTTHAIRETERKISSCPVLFTWNGERFEFVTDFAGVGGLGYFVAPGEYAPPQVREDVKIEPRQLAAKDGLYELRICEPMEEVAYVDKLELLAIDQPKGMQVFPDERLAISGPPPTHELLSVEKPIFPARALDPAGQECVERLAAVDRTYAYQPRLDRRFMGFCSPHSLTLDFGKRLEDLADRPGIYMFINGWIEYPYSQTTFAAGQAQVRWDPIRIERMTAAGKWETIVADAGAPGGMGRMFTVNLSGKLPAGTSKLRLSTNLEIYYDQIFIAANRGLGGVTVRPVPLQRAELRRLGFPLEYSPDGRHPWIYSYENIDATSSFKLLKGAYTRYGRVEPLLAGFDDRYVILASGDEIAAAFDARRLPEVPPGQVRSFVLVSHAYCKDMDLYTGEPDTVTPLPFRRMSKYPYPAGEHYPDGSEHRRYLDEFNTRLVN